MADNSEENKCCEVWRKIHGKTIEEDEYGRARNLRLFSAARPHMRAFHASWFCFFIAFLGWFAAQPLMPTIQQDLKLTKKDVADSGIASVAATIFIRVIIGPLCDCFGPRRCMAIILLVGTIPVVLAGLAKDRTDLIILRFCVGIIGGTFVPCQFWTSAMFSSNIVGTANALVAGWGNLGGGFTFLIMPAIFKLCQLGGATDSIAWRVAMVFPALIYLIFGVPVILTTDDCPQGHWSNRVKPNQEKMKKLNPLLTTKDKDANTVLKAAETEDAEHVDSDEGDALDGTEKSPEVAYPVSSIYHKCWNYLNVIILMIHYGTCFGVEISINTTMNLYLLYKFKVPGCEEGPLSTTYAANSTITDETGHVIHDIILPGNGTTDMPTGTEDIFKCSILDQTSASLITSLFGLLNLFARALGGISSDLFFRYFNVPGRLLVHIVCLVCEGILLIVFSRMDTIPSAIAMLAFVSLFVQMSEGTTFSIVPYVLNHRVGIVAGLVAAGGNIGAILWNVVWRQTADVDPSSCFYILGIVVLACSVLSLALTIQSHRLIHLRWRHHEKKPK